MAREELAPSVVGGLLVSYRLKGELKASPSTEDGTASGCGGSGASLGALGRLEGDEDLAPRVFAMANSKKVVGGARWLELRWGSSGSGALTWLLFRTKERFFARQMMGLKLKFGI